jgi:hypothetical protein
MSDVFLGALSFKVDPGDGPAKGPSGPVPTLVRRRLWTRRRPGKSCSREVYEPAQRESTRSAESTVRKRQAEERELLQKTQSQELKDIQRRRAEEVSKAHNSSDKAKIQKTYEARTAELQRQHQAEKQQLSERQKRDAERVRQAKPARKEAPPKKKNTGQ